MGLAVYRRRRRAGDMVRKGHVMPALAIILLSWLVWPLVVPGHTQERALFQPGQTYTVVWDCAPAFFAAMAAQAAGGAAFDPCFTERLTVQEVRKDGWLQVTEADTGDGWLVNPARMIGFKSAAVPIVAGR